MTEAFIHFLWKFKLYRAQGLCTTMGSALKVLSAGFHNKDSGPDFFDARLYIDDTLWAGNVEIHVRSSDWYAHGHTSDSAYDNVILHVVYMDDKPVLRSDGTPLPTLQINKFLPAGVEEHYTELLQSHTPIPCGSRISTMPALHLQNWFYRLLIERLEEKSKDVYRFLQETRGSWDDTFYILLARNFGFKVNALPFELLARSLPQQLLAKNKDNALAVEALIFGQAGFLGEDYPGDDYLLKMRAEYLFLQRKYGLKPLEKHLWKFLRMRPRNFPSVRLAQFSALVQQSSHLFSKVIALESTKLLSDLFTDIKVNPYWRSHFRPGVPGPETSGNLGKTSVYNLLLNSVALIIFSYGRHTGNNSLVERALSLIESMPFELNHITGLFTQIGIEARGAHCSQALIQLKKEYCDKKNCLNCAIGAKLLIQHK